MIREPVNTDTDADDDVDSGPSKSELKREMQARQLLGEKIAKLNREQLATLPLEARLHEALLDYQRFTHREARRRQMQFIGKLMRDVDVAALEQAWQLTQAGSDAAKKRDHQLERWRERLLENGDVAIQELAALVPGLDRQQLRQWVRDAQKQRAENKTPTASRKLYQFLKIHLPPV